MLARGNGFPPFFFFLIGLIVVPAAAELVGLWFNRRRTAEFGVLLLGSLVSFGIAYKTSRPDPSKLFADIFRTRPPASVKDLRTRAQWFDGPMRLADFTMPEAEFQELVRSVGMKPDAVSRPAAESDPDLTQAFAQRQWHMRVGQWSRLAYDFWPKDTRVSSIDCYERRDGDRQGITSVVREPVTGHVWAVKLSD